MKLLAAANLRYSFKKTPLDTMRRALEESHSMVSKDHAALAQLLELLEARYALRVLWALRDGHTQTFRLLQDSVGGITPNTLNTRIKDLRAAGLLGRGKDGYMATSSGLDLLKRLDELPAFATRWVASQAKKVKVNAAV